MSTGKELSVGLTATCTESGIMLHFDKPGAYAIWKKSPDDKEWGDPIWNNHQLGLQFFDANVVAGQAYEYKVVEIMTPATGYILAGFQVPLPTDRGKLILIVESTYASALTSELNRFINDLQADGYSVVRRDVSKSQSTDQVKATLKDAYLLDPDHTNTAILFGAVPVRLSGPVNYDGHGSVMVASDGFYADMSGSDWSNNPAVFPAKLRLAVGRIDFSSQTCFSNKTPSRSELDLLRQYLNRNHAWRTGQWSIPRKGLVRDRFPDRDFAWNAWNNMPNLCRDGIDEISDGQFFPALTARDYLISFACGGGQLVSMAGVGDSNDFATNNIRVPFLMLLGSAFLGRWDCESNFLRSGLASGDDERGCLAAFGAGAPHVLLHRFAAGGTLGESFLLSQNNFALYEPNGNTEDGLYSPSQSTGIPPCAGLVHNSLMGDPTLRLFPIPNEAAPTPPIPPPPPPTPPMPPTPGAPMSKATFVKADPETQGKWVGTYGQDGALIASGINRMPSYATVNFYLGATVYQWTDKSHEPRALQTETTDGRIAAAWNHAIGFTVEVKADAMPHRLALFFLDWDRMDRKQLVEVRDGASGELLDSREIYDFSAGVWLVYDFQGSITIRITNIKIGITNCVLSAMMFGPAGATPPVPNPGATRTLEILSGPTSTGPWTSRGTVEVEASSPTEFFKLAIR